MVRRAWLARSLCSFTCLLCLVCLLCFDLLGMLASLRLLACLRFALLASFGSLARELSLWNLFEPIFLAKTALLAWRFEVEHDKLKTVLNMGILKFS